MKLKCQKQPEYLVSQNDIFSINIRLLRHLGVLYLDWDTSPWVRSDTFISCLPEENIRTEWNSFSLLACIPIFKYWFYFWFLFKFSLQYQFWITNKHQHHLGLYTELRFLMQKHTETKLKSNPVSVGKIRKTVYMAKIYSTIVTYLSLQSEIYLFYWDLTHVSYPTEVRQLTS